jgi:hypothetical protein
VRSHLYAVYDAVTFMRLGEVVATNEREAAAKAASRWPGYLFVRRTS